MPRMTLGEHLSELRWRLVKCALAVVGCMIVAFVFYEEVRDFMFVPYTEAALASGITDAKLQVLSPGEGFLSLMRLCFLAGLVAASPVVLWQLWQFIAAGLYEHERRMVRIFFPVGLGLFTLGLVVAYVLLIPFGLRWLLDFNVHTMGVSSGFQLDAYVSFCLSLVFGMGLAFEMPLVLLFLQGAGVIQRSTLVTYWRHAVVGAFLLGAVLTADPSPVTQVLMSLPLCGLYFLAIWGGRFVGSGKERFVWWKAWPIYLGLGLFVALLIYAKDLTAWWSSRNGPVAPPAATAPPAPPAPASPPASGPEKPR